LSRKLISPWQFGIYDSKEILHLLVPIACIKGLCLVTVKESNPKMSVSLEMLHLLIDKLLKDGILENESMSIKIRAIVPDFSVESGDTLGCGFLDASNLICFTHNGSPMGNINLI
jgi:hypothetical protein